MISAQKIRLPFTLRRLNLTAHEKAVITRILAGTDAWIARYFNKTISLPFSVLMARKGITPNQITGVNLVLGILSGLIAAFGGYFNLVFAGILFKIVSIIDGCDGEVAKLNDKATRFGGWFDTVGDNLSFVAFITGVTFGLYHQTHAAWIVTAAEISLVSFAILLSIMVSYLIQSKGSSTSLITYEKEVVSKSLQNEKGLVPAALRFGKFLVKKDFFAFLFFVLAVTNFPQGIVFFAALGSSAVAIVLSILTIRKRRTQQAAVADRASQIIQS